MFLGSTINTFGNNDLPNIGDNYKIISTENSNFGKVYYVSEKYETRAIAPWDVADLVMAGDSWATLFGDPSWSNFGWAVLDTAAIFPYIPSSGWIRKGGKYVPSDQALKDLAKKDKDKIKNAIKSKISKITKIPRITGLINSQLEKKIKHAFEMKIIDRIFKDKKGKVIADRTTFDLSGVEQNIKEKILSIVGKSREYYEGKVGNTPAILHVDRNNLEIVYTTLSGEFLTVVKMPTREALNFRLDKFLKINPK